MHRIGLALAVCALVGGCRDRPVGPPIEITDAELGEQTGVIVALDRNGEALFRYSVDGEISKWLVSDTDQDGEAELIVGTASGNGRIIAIRADSTILWEAAMYMQSIYGAVQSGEVWINSLNAADLIPSEDGLEVVATVADRRFYPSRIAVLSGTSGEELRTYWNPGTLGQLDLSDFDGDGQPEAIVVGINNDLRAIRWAVRTIGGEMQFERLGNGSEQNFLAVFRVIPGIVSGQAPPYASRSTNKGNHDWYGIIRPQGGSMSSYEIVDADGDGSREIHVGMSNGVHLYVSLDGVTELKIRGDNVDPMEAARTDFLLVRDIVVRTAPDGFTQLVCEIE